MRASAWRWGLPSSSVRRTAILATVASAVLAGVAKPASAEPSQASAPPPVTTRAQKNGWIGVELGYGSSDDDPNLFQSGFGRTLVLSMSRWELRLFETYDLDDPSGLYDTENSEGRMAITSIARRLSLVSAGPFGISGLVGASWVRRPSVRFDPDALIDSDGFGAKSQHGVGAVVGVGAAVSLGPRLFIAADLRVHALAWFDIAGQRVLWIDDQVMTETIEDQPGGFPTTASVTVGAGF